MTDHSAGFRSPCWCPSRWAPVWCLHSNLYQFGENVSPHIFHKKNCCYLNLGESWSLHIYLLFISRFQILNLLNCFDFFYFYLLWMAWQWKPAIVCTFAQSFALHFKILKGLCLILLFIVMYAARHQKEKRKSVTLKGIETIRRTKRKFGNIFAIDRKQARLRKLCCETEKKTSITYRANSTKGSRNEKP